MNALKKLVLAFAVGTAPLALYAQTETPPGGPLNLQQCIDYALRNNLTLRQTQNNVATARNNYQQSVAGILPNLNANMSQSYSAGGRSIDPYTNQVVQSQDFRSDNLSISSNVTVFSGTQNIRNINRSKLLRHAAEYDVQQGNNDISLQVVNAYATILANKEILRVSQSQLAITREQVARTTKLVDAGSSARVTLLNLKAQEATDELAVISAENNLASSKLQLQQFMNMQYTESFDVVTPAINVPNNLTIAESSSQIFDQALETQPNIKAADFRIRAADQFINQNYGAISPTLTLSGGFFTNYSSLARQYSLDGTTSQVVIGYYEGPNGAPVPIYTAQPNTVSSPFKYKDQVNNNLRRSLQLNLSVPLFNGWQTKTAIANAKIAKLNTKAQADQTKLTLRQNIETAYLAAKLAGKNYYATQNQVESLRESFRANEQRLNVGAINPLDYNTSKNLLLKAESDFIRAKFDYIVKSKVLDFYQGKKLTLD